jgi:hypothetical protein
MIFRLVLLFLCLASVASAQTWSAPRRWYQQSAPGGALTTFLGSGDTSRLLVTQQPPSDVAKIELNVTYYAKYRVTGTGISTETMIGSIHRTSSSLQILTLSGSAWGSSVLPFSFRAYDDPFTESRTTVQIDHIVRKGDPNTGPIVVQEPIGVITYAKTGNQDIPVAPQTINQGFVVHWVEQETCPPRDLYFEIDLTLPASGRYNVELFVDGQVKLSTTYSNGVVGKTVQRFGVPSIKTTSGNFIYKWRVNGVDVKQGAYGCSDEIVAGILDSATAPAPLPLIDPGDVDSPKPPATTPPGTAPKPNPTPTPPKGSTPSGTSPEPTKPTPKPKGPIPMPGAYTGENEQEDIYEAVRKALTDSGKEAAAPDIDNEEPEDIAPTMDERGKLDEIQDKLSESVWNADNAKRSISTKFVEYAKVNLPSAIGTVKAVNLGSFSIGDKKLELRLDFEAWSGPISLMRTAILWVSGAVWVFATVNMVKGYL